MNHKLLLFLLSIFVTAFGVGNTNQTNDNKNWIDEPQNQWPQITMINHIEYIDKIHSVAGCSFLLDTGDDTLAATAKHILTYFKSKNMNSVSFKNTLKTWKMYPKNNPVDSVIVDKLINENADEAIDKPIASKVDWLLFSIKKNQAIFSL
jgi:hypothetical protein